MTELVFLFAYFTGNGEKGARIASSEDGLKWADLPEAEFVIAPEYGLMRDPFLFLGPDECFHLTWTTDWESREIGYAISTDLVNWSEQRRLPVMRDVKGARNCWAPEIAYDRERGGFIIFWASTVAGMFPDTAGNSESDYNHRIWYVTTPDFKTFSKPSIYFDPGFNVIDATLHRLGDGSAKLICKDERLHPEKKNLFVCDARSPIGPFSEPSQAFTKYWVEGPATLQLGDWTYVYFDVYREKRYEAMRTKDFQSWEDVSEKIDFPAGARHGSIVTVSREKFETILRALGATCS